ncbi:unnamed protein product [Didymodactylos carnosus]|uniref:Uncharacterized protein n=1 Tax=Didymodactylos carnosus TaxID=1234261 RepID=A0A813XIX0_9BILA|nr:unnamed protein product [Didymodactylos carnosus]CAF0991323.1 unnamed protein product [Didymodactylos carnosus]CAF3660960.1 unnamed protein product [Didymodactylos carnosus]CAF3761381.1 unnamed protein product [Didymodactylos carnosus]
MNYRVFTLTRYWGSAQKDLDQLHHFINQAETYSSHILIGVNASKDLTNFSHFHNEQMGTRAIPVDIVPITPWYGISSPLNILLNRVSSLVKNSPDTIVLIQSPEIRCTSTQVKKLLTYMDLSSCLCIGASLDGHLITTQNQNVPVRGETCPWNTFTLWNWNKLIRTGFLSTADLVQPAGMEEVPVICLQQKLFGGKQMNRAILIKMTDEDILWNNEFEHDTQRRENHLKKLRSKNERTRELMKILQINETVDDIGVEHIIVS